MTGNLENTLIHHGQTDFEDVVVPSKSYLTRGTGNIDRVHTTQSAVKESLTAETTGKKFDSGKPGYHLMPLAAEQEVVKVLTYGAMKYDEENWRKVKPLNQRYYSAARRHMSAFMTGETRDGESSRHHLAHAICCLLFMLENDLNHELRG